MLPETRAIAPDQPPEPVPATAYPIPSTSLLSIEHPAILSSVDAGLRTLGGQSALTKAVKDHDNAMLELRYRPGDRYAHPIISQRQKARNIVIKLSKSKADGKIKDVEVVGVTDTILRFRDIADLQYHPFPDSKFANKFEATFSELNYENLSKFDIDLEDDDPNNLDIMPPPLFSRTNIPSLYNYKQNTGLIAANGRFTYRYIFRNKFTTMIEKSHPTIPSSPSPNLDPPSQLAPSTQLCIKRLQSLFADREIFTRRAIYNTYLTTYGPGTVNERENWRPVLRFALPYVCYMWKSGPFRDAYCLFGVDPRKDKKWAGYQTAIFNFRQDKESPKKVKEETAEMQAQEKEGKSHLFTGRDVGTKVASYCFRDVTDPMLRKILDDVVLRDKFHENDGWYPSDVLVKVKKVMRAKLLILREGRVPSDSEVAPLLLETNPSTMTPGIEQSLPPEEEEIPEEDEDEDEGEVEGETMPEDKQLETQVDLLMQNLLQQSEAHQIGGQGSSVITGGEMGEIGDKEFEDIYGNEDED